MVELYFKQRLKNKSGDVIGYRLMDKDGKYVVLNPDALINSMKCNKVNVIGLSLVDGDKIVKSSIDKSNIVSYINRLRILNDSNRLIIYKWSQGGEYYIFQII